MSTAGARLQSQVGPLLDKMTNSDADFRFMALDDLMKLNARENLSSLEEPFEKKMVELVLKLVKDTNSEVKSKAANCLGFLVRTVREFRMQEIMDTLVDYISSKDHALRDVASLGLKIVVGEIPADSPLAKSACDKLTPKLIAVLHDTSSSPELLMDSMDVLADIYTRFSSIISKNVNLQSQSLNGLTKMLVHTRVAVRKRSLVAIGALGSVSTSDIFTQLSKQVSAELQSSDNDRINTAIQLIGTLSKTCPRRLGRRLPEFMPRVLSNADSASKKAGSEDEDDADNDLRENALNTITSILLRCPAEVTPFVNQSVELALKFIKYDPNYAEEMDEDEPEAVDSDDKMDEDPTDGDDEEEDEDDEGLEDEDYSDDEDLSWKVRRASSKVLTAIISSRPELLSNFSSSVAPVLVSRFKEREESVRIEVLSTFNTFLIQVRNTQGGSQATEVIGAGATGSGVTTANGTGPGALKRKRSSMDIDGEEKHEDSNGPIAQVRSLVPAIAKALSKELTSKSNVTKISTVAVLRELMIVLRGGLDGYISRLVTSIDKALKVADSSSGPGSNLKAEALSFFRILFLLHEPNAFASDLSRVVPILTNSMGDKMHRNSIESFYASGQLVSSLRPIGSSSNSAFKPYLVEVYNSTLQRLSRSDSDQEIKECSIACLGTLLANAGDDLEDKYPECLPLLNDRLKSEVTRLATIKVLNEICKTNVCKGAKFDEFLNESLIEISNLLRQSNRQIKISSFVCLVSLLKKTGANLSDVNSKHILNELEPLLKNEVDQNLYPLELNVIELILENNKNSKSEKLIQDKILPSIYKSLESSLITGLALDSLLNFFRSLLKIDSAISADIISNLMKALENSKKNASNGNKHIIATISRCIGAVLISARDQVDNVITSRAKVLESKNPSSEDVYFSLLLLGEIGRFESFSNRQKLLEKILSFYKTDSEEIKLAASFSIGNIAVGNLAMVLPVIENHIATKDSKDSKDKLLSLNALKELISHGSNAQLEELAPKFWEPLFEVSDSKDEATRNLGSECLARLTLTDPNKYLSELRDSLKSPSSNKRATVISAVRFTLTDTNKVYDEILKEYIIDFLSCLNDDDIEVRKNSMLVFNSTVHNKPGLIKDHLDVLLPLLYKETKRNEKLIRKVPMGPFTVTIDDGLDLRKNAFETMYTLLDECLAKINIPQYMSHITVGLTDDDSIKTLCYLTLMRLADLSPLQVSQHIEDVVEPTAARLKELAREKEKNKDTKTKQEIEKFNQLTRSIFRALVSLERLAAQAPKFNALISGITKGDQAKVYQEVQSQFVSNPVRGRNLNGGIDFD